MKKPVFYKSQWLQQIQSHGTFLVMMGIVMECFSIILPVSYEKSRKEHIFYRKTIIKNRIEVVIVKRY